MYCYDGQHDYKSTALLSGGSFLTENNSMLLYIYTVVDAAEQVVVLEDNRILDIIFYKKMFVQYLAPHTRHK
jgi:hypothetical protein